MKIDTNTINVLKNFAKINPSIVVQEGNTLKTISTSKTIMAKANVPTNFNKKFAIYNLDQFISYLSLFNDPDLNFSERAVDISDGGRSKGNFIYADESTVTKVPEREINLPTVDVKVTLKNEDLKEVEKAAGVLQLPEIAITGDGENVYLKAIDSKNPSGNTFKVLIGNTDKTFTAIFKYENLKVIPGDYEVSVCSKGISHFVGKDIEYWIAVENNSSF